MLKQEELTEGKGAEKNPVASTVTTDEKGMNAICRGYKVAGTMVVRQDLQMNGAREENITAETPRQHDHRCFANRHFQIDAGKSMHLHHRMAAMLPIVHRFFLPIILVLVIVVLSACKGSGSNGNPQVFPALTAPVISAYTASPSVITPGQSSHLAWTVKNTDGLALNGIATAGSGTIISPATTTTYTLVATNSVGSASASITITVGSLAAAYGNMKPADIGAGANLNGAIPFPASNPWNTDISTAPVDANSGALISSIGPGTGLHPDFGSGLYAGAPIGIPYVVVGGSQPMVTIQFVSYAGESDPGPYPVPVNAPIEGQQADGSAFGGDRHVLVIDRDANLLYELANAYPQNNGTWQAGCGAVFHLDSNNVRPNGQPGWTSADAAGLPIFPGLVRYEEAASGVILHALRFTVSSSRRAYVPPATHWASSNTNPDLPPMGMRVRLKSGFTIPSGFSTESKAILQALKTYGMFMADNGGNWFISGAPDARWNNGNLMSELNSVKGSDFEVVRMDGLVTP